MEIHFCDRCSCRITDGELAEGYAYSFGSLFFCEKCWSSEQVVAMIRKTQGLMAAVHEGGAGASTYNDRATPRPGELSRKSPPRLRSTPVDGVRRKGRRRSSPKYLRAIGRRTPPGGRRTVARGVHSQLNWVLIAFGAAALAAFIAVGAILLLASNRRVSYQEPGDSTRNEPTSLVCASGSGPAVRNGTSAASNE